MSQLDSSSSMEIDLENPLTLSEDALFLTESDHILNPQHFDVSIRSQVVSSISQLSCNFDPFLNYLAVNYLDRFLSCQGTTVPKPWAIELLAVSCVSLATKMLKIDLSSNDFDFQCGGGFVFDTQTIQRMEKIILGALKWSMRPITPFSFLFFFISFFKLSDPPLLQALKARASEIIFMAQKDFKLFDFKPSVVSASALLSASHELFPLQFPFFKKSICNCSFVNKEIMLQCFEKMEGTLMDGWRPLMESTWSSVTPENVLDLQFSSCSGESDGSRSTTTAITRATVRSETGEVKKRRIRG